MATSNLRVLAHRKRLRKQGLRPVQFWVPDTRTPGYAAECRRESALIAQAEAHDARLLSFEDAVLREVEGWTS